MWMSIHGYLLNNIYLNFRLDFHVWWLYLPLMMFAHVNQKGHRDLLFDNNISIGACKYKEEYRLTLFSDIIRREYITINCLSLKKVIITSYII